MVVLKLPDKNGVFCLAKKWIDIFHEKSGCRFVKDSGIVSGRICCLYYGHQLSPGNRFIIYIMKAGKETYADKRVFCTDIGSGCSSQ
jgi:hypothetical protein